MLGGGAAQGKMEAFRLPETPIPTGRHRMLLAFGLASAIYLVVSDLDLRWKVLAVALFGLGLVIIIASTPEDSTRMIASTMVFTVLALWGVIHWSR